MSGDLTSGDSMSGEPLTPVAVVGATGTGKSDLAVALCERLGGEVVNCDAMQQYRGMDVGTAKLTEAERRGIPHHLLDVLEVTETASVAAHQERATALCEDLLARGIVPVLCGGSMLYVQALLDRWEFPETDPSARERYERRLAEEGVATLHADLARVDAEAAASILPSDPRRVVRALEVVEITGRPFAASKPEIGEPRWGTRILGLRCALPELDARLEARTARMMAGGLVDEVRGLIDVGLLEGTTARRAIGYAQVLDELGPDGELLDSLDEKAASRAEERTFVATRRYVRRQRSWFGRDGRIRWLDTDGPVPADALVADALAALRTPRGATP